jgi:hypothetical protein
MSYFKYLKETTDLETILWLIWGLLHIPIFTFGFMFYGLMGFIIWFAFWCMLPFYVVLIAWTVFWVNDYYQTKLRNYRNWKKQKASLANEKLGLALGEEKK